MPARRGNPRRRRSGSSARAARQGQERDGGLRVAQLLEGRERKENDGRQQRSPACSRGSADPATASGRRARTKTDRSTAGAHRAVPGTRGAARSPQRKGARVEAQRMPRQAGERPAQVPARRGGRRRRACPRGTRTRRIASTAQGRRPPRRRTRRGGRSIEALAPAHGDAPRPRATPATKAHGQGGGQATSKNAPSSEAGRDRRGYGWRRTSEGASETGRSGSDRRPRLGLGRTTARTAPDDAGSAIPSMEHEAVGTHAKNVSQRGAARARARTPSLDKRPRQARSSGWSIERIGQGLYRRRLRGIAARPSRRSRGRRSSRNPGTTPGRVTSSSRRSTEERGSSHVAGPDGPLLAGPDRDRS